MILYPLCKFAANSEKLNPKVKICSSKIHRNIFIISCLKLLELISLNNCETFFTYFPKEEVNFFFLFLDSSHFFFIRI